MSNVFPYLASLTVSLLAALVSPGLGQQAPVTPYFAVHLVVDCTSSEKVFVKERNTGKQYCIEPSAVVTDRDVSSAKSSHDDRPSLIVTFGAAGSERLYQATSAHWLEDNARLATLINGELIGVFRIFEPLRDDAALLSGGAEEEVSLWANALQSRAHPSVQVREVVLCPPGGGAALPVEGTSVKYCLSHSPLLDERDISSAELAKTNQGEPGLSVHLKASSTSKVRQSTQNLVGSRVGILVNNRLMMVFSVTAPLAGTLIVSGKFTDDELHALVDGISAETHTKP
jgi:preprotein translocase subunit SecD